MAEGSVSPEKFIEFTLFVLVLGTGVELGGHHSG